MNVHSVEIDCSHSFVLFDAYVLAGLRQVHSQTCDEGSVSQPWPALTILDVGNIPFFMLLESYDSLQINGLSTAGGVDTATQLQRLASISELLEMWVDAALSSYSTSPMIGSNNLYPSGEVSSASSEVRETLKVFCFISFIFLCYFKYSQSLFLHQLSLFTL